jgi:hypothetical protein
LRCAANDILAIKETIMSDNTSANSDKLCVIWSSGDREVALELVFKYTLNSKLKDWWTDVRLVVWGPSERLLTHDKELQDHVFALTKEGVEVMACKGCSDNYGVSTDLSELGVNVLYTGVPLTEMLKSGWTVLTF